MGERCRRIAPTKLHCFDTAPGGAWVYACFGTIVYQQHVQLEGKCGSLDSTICSIFEGDAMNLAVTCQIVAGSLWCCEGLQPSTCCHSVTNSHVMFFTSLVSDLGS